MTSRTRERSLVYALQHPVRRRVLRALQGNEASFPRELAEQLAEPIATVSYHVRVLAECGAVTLVDEKPARGAMTHYYAFDVQEDWALFYLASGVDKAS